MRCILFVLIFFTIDDFYLLLMYNLNSLKTWTELIWTLKIISTNLLRVSKILKKLIALRDENRQHLILKMMSIDKCDGVRIGEIVSKSNLSRPAVSLHLKILKEAGIVKMRKEVTKNYYYFEPDEISFNKLIDALELALEINKLLLDRSKEREDI